MEEQYGISRITVRTVLDMLAKEGLIYRQAGRGTFVALAAPEQGLSQIISFAEDLQSPSTWCRICTWDDW